MSSKTKLDIWSWRAQVSFHSSSDHSVMEYIVSPREFPLYIIYTSDIVVMTYAVIGSPKHPSVVFIPIIVMKIGNIVITEHKNMPEPSMLSYFRFYLHRQPCLEYDKKNPQNPMSGSKAVIVFRCPNIIYINQVHIRFLSQTRNLNFMIRFCLGHAINFLYVQRRLYLFSWDMLSKSLITYQTLS